MFQHNDEVTESKIVHCNFCDKMIASELAQEFKSESPLIRGGFIICIPCTLRLKDKIKYVALKTNEKGEII